VVKHFLYHNIKNFYVLSNVPETFSLRIVWTFAGAKDLFDWWKLFSCNY